jgi:predicted small integral membrane protein
MKKNNTSKLISGIYIFFCFLKIQGWDIRNPTKKKRAGLMRTKYTEDKRKLFLIALSAKDNYFHIPVYV